MQQQGTSEVISVRTHSIIPHSYDAIDTTGKNRDPQEWIRTLISQFLKLLNIQSGVLRNHHFESQHHLPKYHFPRRTTRGNTVFKSISAETGGWTARTTWSMSQLRQDCCTTFFLAIIALSTIMTGLLNMDSCPAQHMIPIWLVVYGTVCAWRMAFGCCCGEGVEQRVEHVERTQFAPNVSFTTKKWLSTQTKNPMVAITGLFLFLWPVIGVFWVYGIYNSVQHHNPVANYCDGFTYIISAIFTGFTCILSILTAVCACCYCLARSV